LPYCWRNVVSGGGSAIRVSAAGMIRWRQLVIQNSTPATKLEGGNRRAGGIDAHTAFILGAIEAKDDITLVELQEVFAQRGTPGGGGTLWRFFDRHRITRKENALPSRTVPHILMRREAWFEGQLDLAPKRLVSIGGVVRACGSQSDCAQEREADATRL
jgi:hypothetical protein